MIRKIAEDFDNELYTWHGKAALATGKASEYSTSKILSSLEQVLSLIFTVRKLTLSGTQTKYSLTKAVQNLPLETVLLENV